MTRGRGAAILCGIVAAAASVVDVTPADGRPISARRAAGVLARLIRRDAREGGPSSTTLVRDRSECCSVRAIDVYYRASPKTWPPCPASASLLCQEPPGDGAYHLRLRETTRGRPLAVSVREFGTAPGYQLGTESHDHASSLSYSFETTWYRHVPNHLSRVGRPGWVSYVGYSYMTRGKFHIDALPPQRRQAIDVAEKASSLAPVAGEPEVTR
jgi:hypothetical protein